MFRKFLTAFALFSFAGAAHAGDKPLYTPAPAWVKPAPAIDATHLTDADPLLLLVDQQQKLQDGEVWAYYDTATRIASPQVLTQAGTLPIPWDPGKGDLRIHKVEIIRGTEHIDLLASGAKFEVLRREQQLEQAALNGTLTATMAVEGLRVGDVLHVVFSMTRKDPALHGHLQTLAPVVAEPMRLQYGRLRLIWPKDMPVNIRSYLKGAEVQPVDTADGWREVNLKLPVAKPADMPDDAPLRARPLPLLEASNYADWADVSKDVAPLFATQGTIAPGSPLAAEVAKIAAASPDPRTRTALALQLVQDKVRYLFRGMDDGDYVPQAPAQTWTLRYGDCKAKSLLLLAILRELGIEAEATLVNMDAGDLVSIRLPMPGAFNHVIVRATVGGETLWLDGTGAGARATDLGDVPPFRNALPLRAGGATLLAMPMRPDARPAADADIEIDASAGVSFPMPYKAKITMRGGMAEGMRVVSAQAGEDQLNLFIDSLLGRYIGSNLAVNRAVKYDEATGTATITANGVVYSTWAKDGDRYKVQLDSIVDGLGFAPDRGRPAWKEIPVAVASVDDRHMRIRIKLPERGTGFALEGDQTLPETLATAALKRNVTLADGWITLDDRITNGIREVAPAEIPAVRGQVARAKARLLKAVAPADYPAPFRQIAAARKAKALDPALAVFARAIAEKPDQADRYTARAWFLETTYDRQGALRDIDKALELSPDVDTWLWRARLHSALNDDKAAITDVRSALELDPSSQGAIGQLATLESKQGKGDEALAMIEEHAQSAGKEKPGYVMLQADLLGEAGKVDEALALLDSTITATPGRADLLNSRCWIKGTRNVALDTALKDCTKSIELSENPAPALDSRAMVYFRMNRFDDALADLDGALDAAPDLAASLYMRGVIRKKMGNKAGDDDLAAARMIAPRIDEDYAKYGIRP